MRAEMLQGLLGGRRADVDRAGVVLELLEVELMVAADESERERPVENHRHRLDLVIGPRAALDLLERGDGAHSGGGEAGQLPEVAVLDRCERGGGPLDVGGVAANPDSERRHPRRRGRGP